MKVNWKDYLLLLTVAGAIVALDQWTKALVRAHVPMGGYWMPLDWLAPYVRIIHWYNTGAAFGIFQGGNLVFTILASVVAIAIVLYFPQVPAADRLLRAALILQLAGAVGNLIDRITLGKVTDFIQMGFPPSSYFPVYNVADACITIGVGVLLLGLWQAERRAAKEAGRGG